MKSCGEKTALVSLLRTEHTCDQDSAVVGAVVTLIDISERKKVEAELKEYVADLERFNRLVVGREERMIQLKEEINGLLEKLGGEKESKIV